MAYEHRLRVRYNECDPQGIVFNANFLVYADVACNELWRDELGGYDAFLAQGLDIVVGEANVRYLAPARFDEELDVEVTVAHLGTTSFTLLSRIARDGEPIAEVRLRYVCIAVAGDRGSTPVPDGLRRSLERHLTPEAVPSSSGT